MSTAIHDIKKLIDSLPKESSVEDIQYHLYVLGKVRSGQSDIKNGQHFTTEQAKERLGKWLEPKFDRKNHLMTLIA